LLDIIQFSRKEYSPFLSKRHSLVEKITIVDKETIEVDKSCKKDRAQIRGKMLQGNEGKAWLTQKEA
jgi:hypothetical protein